MKIPSNLNRIALSAFRRALPATSSLMSSSSAHATTSSLQTSSLDYCEGTVIVGGGIAGLATAAALHSIAKLSCIRILESCPREKFLDDSQGAALILTPNGLKALRALGGDDCLQCVLKEGSHIHGNVLIHSHQDEITTPDTTRQTTGLPQVLIRWGILRRILRELVTDDNTDICITTDVEATNYRVLENGHVQLLNESGDVVPLPSNKNNNTVHSTPLLIAADGMNSKFSRILHPTKNIRDNGRVNIKAVVPKLLPKHEEGITYSYFNGDIACFAGPAGDEYTYWAISLLSKENHDNETDLNKIKSDLLTTLSTIQAPSFILDLIQETLPQHIFVRQSQESIHVCDLYSNNVVLVGDAAHAMSPSYGQCGSMALEDAVTLASCLSNSDSLQQALSNYSQQRTCRSEEMVKRSAERTKKAVKGEATEDVSQWIFQWEPPSSCT